MAQANNLMGLMCTTQVLVSRPPPPHRAVPFPVLHDAQLPQMCRGSDFAARQTAVPALVGTVKVAGLVLVADAASDAPAPATRGAGDGARPAAAAGRRGGEASRDIDGVLGADGTLRFHDTIEV